MEEQPDRYIIANKHKEKKRIIDLVPEDEDAGSASEGESKAEPQTAESKEVDLSGAAEQDHTEVPAAEESDEDIEAIKAAKIPLDEKLLAMN